MERLSADGRSVYELLRADATQDIEQIQKLLKDQGEQMLQTMNKMLEANNAALDSLISARVDAVHQEVAIDME